MTAKELQTVIDIFPDSTFEAISGLYIYDNNGQMICAYLNEGFSLNMDYKHVEAVRQRLEAKGYSCWYHQLMQDAELQELA